MSRSAFPGISTGKPIAVKHRGAEKGGALLYLCIRRGLRTKPAELRRATEDV